MELSGVEVSLGHFHLHVDVTLLNGITGLFGASGAGKTTLLEVIAGLRKPDKGRLTNGGQILFDTRHKTFVPARKRKIGYVPQDLALFPHLTVLKNICYGERSARTGSSRASFDTICDILEIRKNLHQYPNSLSGGEKQRVAFARALMANPSFLLLDEPVRGLEQELKEKVLSFLLHIGREFSIPMLYVTHSPSEVMALCTEVILLESGKQIGRGKPSDFFFRTDAPVYQLRRDAKS
jgi:molybdate transport system ATP-binding protein